MSCDECNGQVAMSDRIHGFCPKCLVQKMPVTARQSESRVNRPVPNVKVVFVNQGVTGRGAGAFAKLLGDDEHIFNVDDCGRW